MEAPWPWHRLFGLSLIGFFQCLPVTVEVEGVSQYRERLSETSALLRLLFLRHNQEEPIVVDLMQELMRDKDEIDPEFVDLFPREVLLKVLSTKARLKEISPDEIIAILSTKDRLKGLSPDEILRAISPETRASLMKRLKDADAAPRSGSREAN